MKINVTNSHITSAIRSEGKRTPVEIAILDLDCFEEIHLQRPTENRFSLTVDGNAVKLPAKVQKGLLQFYEEGEMEAMSFDLPLDEALLLGGGEVLFESMDDLYGFGMNY